MKSRRLAQKRGYFRQHWRRLSLEGAAVVTGLLVVLQLAAPANNLPLYTTIDGVNVGNMSRDDAIKLLDQKYKNLTIDLFFGGNSKPYRQPHPGDIGLTIGSRAAVQAKMAPLWLRLIPTSKWWAYRVLPSAKPTYTRDNAKAEAYVQKELGQSCDVKPQNASLIYQDNKLQVVPAIDGGTCTLTDVTKVLVAVAPRLGDTDLRIPMNQNSAKIHDGTASDFAARLMARTKNVTIKAGNDAVAIPQQTLLSWLDFTAPDSGLVATVNLDRAADFFAKQLTPKVSVASGTTYVTTVDFTETARTTGVAGQTLDGQATAAVLTKWLSGSDVELVAQVTTTPAKVVYSRSYSATDTGLAALLTQYAQAHAGTFGVSYIELDGQHRHAGYNDSKIFETASTYKLFVAYSTLKRIDSGQWHWTDLIQGGNNLKVCFNKMIELSDNDCAEALLNKIGLSAITNEIQAFGLWNSSFMNDDYIQSTPGDLSTFLGMLQAGQLLSPSSTATFLSAMKQNVYRQGIPAGAGATVADKVGFLSPGYIQGVAGTVNLLHDASIVYDPSGTYVLVVMTGNSSWSTIADLTRAIVSWRATAQPT